MDNIMTCISFLLHTHVNNSTDMEQLKNTTSICHLTQLTQKFIKENLQTIFNVIFEYGDVFYFRNEKFRIILRKHTRVCQIYDELISKVNLIPCDAEFFEHKQKMLFMFLYSQNTYMYEPDPKYCQNGSYTWSINPHTVCIPDICSESIRKEWDEIAPSTWKNSMSYSYKFREISVPLHEIVHIDQTRDDVYKNEWEASYYSFSNLSLIENTQFSYVNLYRFLLFHESLVRNLYTELPKYKTDVIFDWNNEKGEVHNLSEEHIEILYKSIVTTKDKKLNTFAKTFAALEWYMQCTS